MSTLEQVKSKERVAKHGEVFTNEREVKAMLDLVKHETERIESRFLEPACGNGNFLAEVLHRKLLEVDKRNPAIQNNWERDAFISVSSIYGVDILEDNAKECQDRLFGILSRRYIQRFGTDVKPEFLVSIRFVLEKNILWGDALDFINPATKRPIVFTEWTMVTETLVKRHEYIFKYLVEKSFQYTISFNDMGEPGAIDESVNEFPPVDFLKLGR